MLTQKQMNENWYQYLDVFMRKGSTGVAVWMHTQLTQAKDDAVRQDLVDYWVAMGVYHHALKG